MCPGVRTRIGSIFIARSSDAKQYATVTQLICEDSSASSNVRTRCEKQIAQKAGVANEL